MTQILYDNDALEDQSTLKECIEKNMLNATAEDMDSLGIITLKYWTQCNPIMGHLHFTDRGLVSTIECISNTPDYVKHVNTRSSYMEEANFDNVTVKNNGRIITNDGIAHITIYRLSATRVWVDLTVVNRRGEFIIEPFHGRLTGTLRIQNSEEC